MANIKITALAAIAAANISATDILPIVDADAGVPTTYKVTAAQLRTALLQASVGTGWGATDYLGLGSGTVPSSGMVRSGQGAITADAPLINSTATWNNVAITFRHLLVNITDTASTAGSLFADFQVAGVSKWSVTKTGAVTQAAGLTVSAGGITVSAGGVYVLAGGITVTGNSTITGTLGGLTGLTVASGGVTVTAGSTAVQALTATSGAFSGAVQANQLTSAKAGAANITINTTDAGADSKIWALQGETAGQLRLYLFNDALGSSVLALSWARAGMTLGTLTINAPTTALQGVTATNVTTSGAMVAAGSGQTLGFFGVLGQAKATVSGSRAGNAALASLLTQLAAYGLVTDSTTA